ncbi:sigma-54-dependent Fis family transcriptional regulator [Candidatus Dependentiae bacterium]|nr:sigma-54-dependent Fis family transcriptional regulator [Candidatus Dependentiae bacterium]
MENQKLKLLIVDDEILLSEFLEITFKRQGYEIYVAHNIKDGYNLFLKNLPDIAILDYKLPDGSGMDLLKKITDKKNDITIILITAYGNIDTAVEAMKIGAADFVTKPFSAEQIISSVERGIIKTKNKSSDNKKNNLGGGTVIIGNCRKIKDIFNIMDKVSKNDTTVLITGESGTGKELVARYIHYNSDRNANPFVTVNCSAIPDTLLESELFGHKRGSFTGAYADKIGLFEAADKGAIFLDEIGDITPALQVKLLRVIEEKYITPIGSTSSKKINLRILAATNKNLEKEVLSGNFREDLYYRLNVIDIKLPPLRERENDIMLLANHFIKLFSLQYKKNITGFDSIAIEAIKKYSWPGNIRELENIIKRAVILSEKNIISVDDMFGSIPDFNKIKITANDNIIIPETGIDLNDILYETEKKYIFKALEKSNGQQNIAAQYLNLNRTTLISKMKKFKII